MVQEVCLTHNRYLFTFLTSGKDIDVIVLFEKEEKLSTSPRLHFLPQINFETNFDR